jgi:hypothetical protein
MCAIFFIKLFCVDFVTFCWQIQKVCQKNLRLHYYGLIII